LIELLVVTAVIAILAAIVLPALSKAKQATKATLCANNMHQLAVAAMDYDADNKRLPSMLEWEYPTNGPYYLDFTKGTLFPYVQSKTAYCCPSETGSILPWGPIDHSYQVSCMSCHAHDITSCLAPARSVFYLEITNLIRGFGTGMAEPSNINGGTTNVAFRHAKREHIIFMDAHFEKLTKTEYTNAAKGDPRFWYPTSDMGFTGFP